MLAANAQGYSSPSNAVVKDPTSMKLCQSMQHFDERPNKDRKKLLVNKSTMDDSVSSILYSNNEAALNHSNCVI